MSLVKKTIIMIDEKNYLIYINHSLLMDKGHDYKKEKQYLKKLVEDYWNVYHGNPEELGTAENIEIIKETFELNDLHII